MKVEFPLEGLHVARLQGSATCVQIKAQVQGNSGLKASTLYIAQIKRKYGILSRACCSKPRSEDAKQPPVRQTRGLRLSKRFNSTA